MNRLTIACALAASLAALTASAGAQTWTALNGTPSISAYNPMLLTDGRVFVQDGDNNDWWLLTPDNKGSYANGTWKQASSAPDSYGPLYYASAVLPDGRVFTMGGEYNFGEAVWQNQGFIYNPSTDSWAPVNAPSEWSDGMGDTGSCTLPNGTLLVADPLSNECSIFNYVTNQMGTPFVNGKADGNDEEGLTLLPNGNVLTVDAVDTPNSEIFNSQTLQWSSAGNTVNLLVQPDTEEIGPAVLRPDGTVIYFGGNGPNAVFNTSTATWATAPSFPSTSGGQLDCADAPACLLPSGNVVVDTSPGFANSGVVFFEWNGTALTPEPGLPTSATDTSFTGNFLMLPTGQALFTNQSPSMYFYTSSGTFNNAWRPTVTSSPSVVAQGVSYTLTGTQLSGMSGDSAYGDDEQNETNYALVRITMTKTGDVFYCPTTFPSTYTPQTGSTPESTTFFVPKNIEQGAGTLVVVTNGIPSTGTAITVGPPLQAYSVETYIGTVVTAGGTANVGLVTAEDGKCFVSGSTLQALGQTTTVEVDFQLPSNNVSSIGLTGSVSAIPGATGYLYLWNYKTNTTGGSAVFFGPAVSVGKSQVMWSAQATGTLSSYIGPGGKVRAFIRTTVPRRITMAPYKMNVDLLELNL